MKKRVLLLSFLAAGVFAAKAQVSLTGNNPVYTQNFNTLASTGNDNALTIQGWVLKEVGASAQANGLYHTDNGSNNAGNTYSYGATSATERALGSLLSGTLSPSFGASFVNNTGQNITGVSVSYKGEHWRRGNTGTNVDSLHFAVSFNADSINDASATWIRVNSLDFWSVNTAASTGNGSLDGNVQSATRSGSSPALIVPGAKVWIRWVDFNVSGTDDGLAIDDFQATFTTAGGGTPDTLVRFVSTTGSIAENAGTYNLPLTYSPVSPTSAFTAQVVLKSGNAANIGNYTTQTASFGANVATASVPVTITDNALIDGPKTFVFAIRNPSGSLLLGADSLFTLTVTDDDAPLATLPVYPIGTVRGGNASGQPDSIGVECELRGTVYGVNLRNGGLEFTINDGTGGIGVFSPASAGNMGYTVTEGDSIHVRGEITVYSGLGQIAFLDTLIVAGQGNVRNPEFVTTLDESTESKLVRIAGVHLVNPSQWTGAPNGFNVDITNGSQTFKMRVHPNTTVYGSTAPTGNFDVIGIGSQFLGTSAVAPFVGQYQIVPRRLEDILLNGSISENEASSKMAIFPNPTEGRFFVNFESASTGKAIVSLKDLTGRTVISKNMNLISGSNQLEINENLAAGAYLVSIEIGGTKAVKRVIVR